MSQTLTVGRALRPVRPLKFGEARMLLAQATPIAAVALVNMAMSVTDTVMAAAHGAEALAAVAVASDLYSIVFYLIAGTIGGLAPLYAAAHEARDDPHLRTLRTAGWTVVALAAMLFAPLIWTAPSVMTYAGLDAALLSRGQGYMQAMALTLVPMSATALLRCRLTAIERPGLLLKVTLLAVPLNAVGNQVLMNGLGGWGGFGITGAGLSSLLVSCFTALALVVMIRRAGDLGATLRIDWGTVLRILGVGLPIGVAMLAEVGVFLGATVFAATLGAGEAAAHAIAIRTAGVTYVVSVGLAQAATVRMARSARPDETMASAMGLSVVAGIALAAALLALAFAANVQGHGDLANTLGAAVPLLVLLAFIEALSPANSAAAGLLRGRSDTRAPMVCAIVGNWLVAAPLGVILASGQGLGSTGIWLGLAAGSTIASLLTIGRLRPHWRAAAIPCS